MASALAAHFRMLGRYNRLANTRLYAACAELDDAARRRIAAPSSGASTGR